MNLIKLITEGFNRLVARLSARIDLERQRVQRLREEVRVFADFQKQRVIASYEVFKEDARQFPIHFKGWAKPRYRLMKMKVKRFNRAYKARKKQLADKLLMRKLRAAGIKINPFMMYFVRVILSVFTGFVSAYALMVIDQKFGAAVMSGDITFTLALALSVWFGLEDDVPIKVPLRFGAPLTFFGMLTPIWLSEGDYPWYGKKLFFDRSDIKVPGMDEFPESQQGFVYTEELVVQIWNHSKDKTTVLESIARDGSTIKNTMTQVIRIKNPSRWVSSSNPILDIADRSRETFRTATSFFTGVDCAAAKGLIGKLMLGRAILTCFIPKAIESNARHSMIQNVVGTRMYREVQDGESIADAKAELVTEIRTNGNKKMRDSITEVSTLDEAVKPYTIDDHLLIVIESLGADYVRTSIGDVTFSAEVATAANKAASEVFQRDSQIASAETVKAAREILRDEHASEPGSELATILAASQDNPQVRVVHVSGSNQLTQGLIAAATQLNTNGGTK